MIHLKKILLITVILGMTACNMHAVPTFELYNKATQPIGVIIQESGYPRREKHIIQPKEQLSLDINITHTLYISIFASTNTLEELHHKNENEAYTFRINALGKRTAYLTWNPTKRPYLYPQTGPWLGFWGRTESGWPLDKKTNIDQSQIK
jgi:hypothetical protein